MSDQQGDTTAAKARRDWVLRVLNIEVPATASTRAARTGISPVQLGKSILLWRRVVAKTAADISALRAKIVTAMHDDEDMQAEDYRTVEGNFRLLDAITEQLNEELVDDLTDLQNAPADRRAAPAAKVQSRLRTYIAFVGSDPVLDMLADNEFLPLTTKADLTAALRGIQAAVAA